MTPFASHATHAAGVELRYEHLTGNDYRFYFTLYRDCSGIATDSSYTIQGTSACGGNITITVNADSSIDVSQVCEGDSDKCQNPASPFMGVKAWYYHGDITLAAPCSLWTFGLSPICNRNNAITSLVGGGGSWCTYIETKLNNLDAPDNSSPVFTALPLFHLCNQIQYIHLYALDPDGDSLVFEMYPPHSDQFTDVQYVNGLSAYQPVTYTVPDSTRFDPVTGDIQFKANAAQTTVVAVRVNEFRNGVFIGSEERDIEVIFNNCTSHAPTATGINQSFSFTSHVCADSLLEFNITVNDIDGDSVRAYWQNNIPGSSITLSGWNNEILTFSWQPSASDINSAPYTFTLYVTDSMCPYVYYNSYQYHIYVDSCFATTGVSNIDHEILFNASWSAVDQSILYSYESSEILEGTLSLLNLHGQVLWRKENISTEKVTGKIPASSLSPGLYLLEMKTLDGGSRTLKVMKN